MTNSEKTVREKVAEFEAELSKAKTESERETARTWLITWLFTLPTPEGARLQVLTFAEEIEEAIARANAPRGGQQVPDHSDLAHVPVSKLVALRRRCRDIYQAMTTVPG